MAGKIRLKAIFDKTQGHCHFCGDPIILENWGRKNVDNLKGVWELDHVIQKHTGGAKDASNCLPACFECNRLRWHYSGQEMREILRLGLLAKREIKKNSVTGKTLIKLREQRLEENLRRRKKTVTKVSVTDGEI